MYGGNVEVCVDGSYFAICDIGWDDRDAQIVCNAIGFSEPFFRKLCMFRNVPLVAKLCVHR